MPRYSDLTGMRFGRLSVASLDRLEGAKRRAYWLCRCDCGIEKPIRADGLTSGAVLSCGCLGKERRKEAAHVTHGQTVGKRGQQRQPPEYRSWSAMKNRCHNPKTPGYAGWGGRGIVVCTRWRNSYENFLADMGTRPPGTSLDRINNDGNYEPGNCRWADAKTQRANRRDTSKQEGAHA